MKMTFCRTLILLTCAITLCGERLHTVVCADDSISQKTNLIFTTPINRILVPADQPDSWPPGDWDPVQLKDYKEFLSWRKEQQPGPKSVQVLHVQYTALLAGSTLQMGTFSANISNTKSTSQLMPLGQMNLAVTSLVWKDNKQKVIWGETGSGNTVLLVPPGRHTLNGMWSLQGKQKTRSVQFDLRLLPSAVSRMSVVLPVGHTLESTSGEIIGPLPAKQSGTTLWRVEPGSETSCRLTVQQTDTVSLPSSLVLMKHHVSFVARRDEMSFQADLNPQVYHHPVERILVNISKGLTIHTVTYGGDFPLSWKYLNKKKQRQLEIKLTDPLLGAGRPIRIEGTVPFSEFREQTLPTFQYPNAFFLEGTLHLQVDSPMKLRSYRQQGYLQTGAVFDAVAGETSTFQQYQSNAKMTVQIAPPPLRMQGRLLSRLKVSDEKAELSSWLEFNVRRGNTFSIECRLPRNWNITHVALQQTADVPLVVISDWNVTPLKKSKLQSGNQRLRIEFRDAIVPGTKQRVFIQAHRNHVGENSVLQLPFITSANIDLLEGWIAVEHLSSLKPRWEKLKNIQVIQNIPQNIKIPPLPKSTESPLNNSPSSTDTKELFFKIEGNNASGKLLFKQRDTIASASPEDEKNVHNQPFDSTSQQADVPVWGWLYTQPGIVAGQPDQNEMTYQFPATQSPLQFQLTLPTDATLGEVSLNGETILMTPGSGGTINLPALPGNQTNSVSIRYSVKSTSNWFGSQHDIPLPRTNHRLVNLRWQVSLTNNQKLTTGTKQIHFHSSGFQDSISWMNRYLGPIGRKATSTLFNPFSVTAWQSLFENQEVTQKVIDKSRQHEETPAGWVIYYADVSDPPEHLKLSVQNEINIHAFAWLCFWGSLLGGVIFRRIDWRWRAGLGTFWLVANIILAYVISSSVAEIFGANIAGTILAILIPIRLVQLSRKPSTEDVPMGSTVTYLNAPSLLLFISCIIFSIQSDAADQDAVSVPSKSELKKEVSLTAMIPVNADRQPAGKLPVIYLNKTLMQQFEEYLRQQKQTPQYLISQAQYTGKIQNRKEITFVAEYEITVLDNDANKEIIIHLPVTNANLGGNNACLVDGKPHAILQHKTGVGYIVKLIRDVNASSARKKGEKITTHQIILQLNPHLVSTEEGTELIMKIPTVVKSRLTIETEKNAPVVQFAHAIGKVITSKNKTKLTAQLGKTDTLKVMWKSKSNGSDAVVQSKVNISPATVVELHPGWVHVRSLIRTHIVKGQIDSLHLKLPVNAVLQDIVTNLKFEQSSQLNSKQETLLSIDFSEDQDKGFQIEVVFDLPLSKQSSRTTVPPLDYFGLNLISQKVEKNISPHLIAVFGPKEFKVTDHQSQLSKISAIPVESFLNDVPGFSASRNLALAYTMSNPTPLSFQLQPKSSVSTVYTNQTVLFNPKIMTWMFNAEVETNDVPAYRHRIQIDPRLKIHSVSVKEDEAERLVRWSRKGTVVTLVLNGQTLGTQDITIQGEMRIPGSDICNIPLIRFEEATVSEANLSIYHTKDVTLSPLGKQLVVEKENRLTDISSTFGKTSIFYGKMTLKLTSVPLQLRVLSLNNSQSKATLLTKLQVDSDQQLQVDTFIQIPVSSESRQPFQLRVPKRWGDDFLIESEEYKLKTEIKNDNSRVITCIPLSPKNTSPAFIHLRKTILSFVSGQLNDLEVVELLMSGQIRNYILVPRDYVWKITNKDVTEVKLSSLETSLVQRVNLNQSSSQWQLHQKNEMTPWEIETTELSMSHEILSFRTEVQVQNSDMIYGQSKIIMVSENSGTVQLTCPTQINLLGIIVNGHVQKLAKTAPHENFTTEISLPISLSHQVNRILVIWSLPVDKRYAKGSLLFPVFQGIVPKYQTITYHSSPDIKLTIPEGSSVVAITSFKRDLLELTELTKALKNQTSPQNDVVLLSEMLIHSFNQFNTQYRVELQSTLEKKTTEQLDDIQAMVTVQLEVIKGFPESQTSETNEWKGEPYPKYGSSTNTLIYHVVQNETDLPTVGIDHKQHKFVIVVLVITLFLVAFPLAHWLFRLELYEWFNRFPLLAWGLGALFWWSCLVASFGGFCLILFVIVATFWNRYFHRGQQHSEVQ